MAELKPNQSIRRFDVFAEYQRLKAMQEKMEPDVAKGYGIWLAKVVAARKFSKLREKEGKKEPGHREDADRELVDNKWRTLGDEPQTDKLFDREIVQRMGKEFYERVFSPAIQRAFETGKEYTDIRDTIRKEWKTGNK